jgi:hypothetical protein
MFNRYKRDENSALYCCGTISLIILLFSVVAWALYIFISTIIMLAEGGWNDIADNCTENLRNTILVFIVCFPTIGNGIARLMSKSETMTYGGAFCSILFIVLSSILTYEFVQKSDTCADYLYENLDGANKAGTILINQMVYGWFMTLFGFIFTFIGCVCN